MAPASIDPSIVVDRNLALELVRVTEAAALAASRWIGRGDKNAADGAAVEAMRRAFDTVAISGTVVIGEGEMDEAPMLYIGEKVGLTPRPRGTGWTSRSIRWRATSNTAKGGPNASPPWRWRRGGFLPRPTSTWTNRRRPGPDGSSISTPRRQSPRARLGQEVRDRRHVVSSWTRPPQGDDPRLPRRRRAHH